MLSRLLLRIAIALATRTSFQPDEYYQSLEPAYRLVFGYGFLTWEWLSPRPIRSIVYPALNVPLYWVLNATGIAEMGAFGDWLLVGMLLAEFLLLKSCNCIPRLHVLRCYMGHSLLSQTFGFAISPGECLGNAMSRPQYVIPHTLLAKPGLCIQLFLTFTCFFHALSLSRSLSNSLETSLTTVALAHYPWDASTRSSPSIYFKRLRLSHADDTSTHLTSCRSDLRTMLIFGALAFAVRPTNAIIWVFLILKLLWVLWPFNRLFKFVIQEALVIG